MRKNMRRVRNKDNELCPWECYYFSYMGAPKIGRVPKWVGRGERETLPVVTSYNVHSTSPLISWQKKV